MQVVTHQNPIIPSLTVTQALQKVLQDRSIGFTDIPSRTHLLKQSLQALDLLQSRYSQFVVIGIGGSSMGPRTLVEMSFTKNIYFLDNVDSVEFQRVWNEISTHPKFANSQEALLQTAFIWISKSGTTIEVLWNYSALQGLLKKQSLEIIDQSFFITEPTPNALSILAEQHKRPHLEIPVDVGGRFSVLTPVGLLVAGLCGYSMEDMHKGAALALQQTQGITEASSLFLESFKRRESITMFWFYNSNYRWFGSWLQQLWAESLGKKTDRSGRTAPHFSTPFIAIGCCDQHSILQQVAHSTEKNRFVCFYSFKSVETSDLEVSQVPFKDIEFMQGRNYGDLLASQSLATQQALAKNDVSTARFQIDDQNQSLALGYLFMYFQLIVATIGEHENINAFDQPGVALGKELALKLLKK